MASSNSTGKIPAVTKYISPPEGAENLSAEYLLAISSKLEPFLILSRIV